MAVTGIICEYNPLHMGHKKQMDLIRREDSQGGIVCLMSGNFVQRGEPAVIDKSLRAAAAIMAGADLVLELPVNAALSSAEGFAAQGVSILGKFCDRLCFGAETDQLDSLLNVSRSLLSSQFAPRLQEELQKGLSFPSARQRALESMGVQADILSTPNNILAVEYCKAILSQELSMEPMVILREGGYHDTLPHPANPSATAVRALMFQSGAWLDYVPQEARECLEGAMLHSLTYGERAILTRLRTMCDAEFEALPYGSEGLWRKFMHNARSLATLEEILTATKSKRYTRTRLNRMMLCAFLGLTQEDLRTSAPYVRVLALNDRGRNILKSARKTGFFPNIGERIDDTWWDTEKRIADLYGLFSESPEAPGQEEKKRIFYYSPPSSDAFY